MTQKKRSTARYAVLAAIAVAAAGALYAYGASSSRETTVAGLARDTHFHGIAIDPKNPNRVYLATHHGFFVVGQDGKARQVSDTRDDFMGFTAHPTESSILFASGHPASGGNLGFIMSKDGGKSWDKISGGANGPVDFHQMDVSKADPRVIYGVHDGLQRSSDGGRTWTIVGPAPNRMIALAASSSDPNTLYAGTESGLQRSADGGRTWGVVQGPSGPVTMVHVTLGGNIYAFVVGGGLVRATEKEFVWQAVSDTFGDDYVLHFAADANGQRLFAITLSPRARTQSVIASRNGGASWFALGTE